MRTALGAAGEAKSIAAAAAAAALSHTAKSRRILGDRDFAALSMVLMQRSGQASLTVLIKKLPKNYKQLAEPPVSRKGGQF